MGQLKKAERDNTYYQEVNCLILSRLKDYSMLVSIFVIPLSVIIPPDGKSSNNKRLV